MHADPRAMNLDRVAIDDARSADDGMLSANCRRCQWRRQIVPDGGLKVYQSG